MAGRGGGVLAGPAPPEDAHGRWLCRGPVGISQRPFTERRVSQGTFPKTVLSRGD